MEYISKRDQLSENGRLGVTGFQEVKYKEGLVDGEIAAPCPFLALLPHLSL